jgi:hypothetical protein
VLQYCGAVGAAMFVTLAAHHNWLHNPGLRPDRLLGVENLGAVDGRGLMAICVLAVLSRALARARARRIIRRDRAAYDAAWAAVVRRHGPADQGGNGLLCLLQERARAARMRRPAPDGVVRQRGRPRRTPSRSASLTDLDPAAAAAAAAEAEAEAELGMPVGDVDQLLLQAAGVQPSLRRKMKAWAAAAGGRFAVDPAGGGAVKFLRWEEIAAGGGEGRVRWTRLKSAERAAEKVRRPPPSG